MVFLRDRTKNPKLESQCKKKKGTKTQEIAHTLTLDTNRRRQVVSKRDVAKSASSSPQKNKGRGDSCSLERKIAALKDAEARSEMELNKPLYCFAARDYEKKNQKVNNPQENNKGPGNPCQDYSIEK